MRLTAAINAALDADLSVHTLFDAPTIAQLAPRLGEDAGRREPLVAVERPAAIPLSFAQNRLWFLDQLHGPSPVYNMAVALRIARRLDVDALRAAFDDVIGRHESLRTTFPDIDGVPFQQIVAARAGRVRRGGRRCHRMAASASWMRPSAPTARHTFDLATEIPFRAKLFRLADDEHVLVGRGAPYRRRRRVDHPAGA